MAHGVLAVALPIAVIFQQPSIVELHRQHIFMYGGYVAAWIIYAGYLLLLSLKLRRLKNEAAEEGVDALLFS